MTADADVIRLVAVKTAGNLVIAGTGYSRARRAVTCRSFYGIKVTGLAIYTVAGDACEKCLT